MCSGVLDVLHRGHRDALKYGLKGDHASKLSHQSLKSRVAIWELVICQGLLIWRNSAPPRVVVEDRVAVRALCIWWLCPREGCAQTLFCRRFSQLSRSLFQEDRQTRVLYFIGDAVRLSYLSDIR